MSLHSHDPREHIRGIHQILISDKKRIGFLFGAGSSFATGLPTCRVPAIADMTSQIVADVKAHSVEFASAVEGIQQEIEIVKSHFTIESLLSSIEAKRAVIGDGTLNGLDAAGFYDFANLVKNLVVKLVSVHETLQPGDRIRLAHSRLSSWVSKARRRFPTEIFTTNYDYLFEIALEYTGIPYFDGFSGSYEPFFCPEAVEDVDAYPHLVKLWKMHGSLGWTYRESDNAVVRDKQASAESILIYPSHIKYNTSKKQPYIGLIDRLCTFLQQDDAVLFTCGYSFGDNHINERIATSLRRGANSYVIAMYYDQYRDSKKEIVHGLTQPDNNVRKMATHDTGGKMSVYGLRHAIVGGKFGKWRLRSEPKQDESIRVSQYFDEDGCMPDKEWEGTGRFLLPDFCKLTEFLNDLSSPAAANLNEKLS
jgi:SIR2-like domain